MTAIAFDTLIYANAGLWLWLWWAQRRERKRDERFAKHIARYTEKNARRHERKNRW